ncbi:MAG: zinc ribbon domain-containing protein [Aureispira sp.]|nr:zinc ribbon domain-containing protein [Aureispira sp.]
MSIVKKIELVPCELPLVLEQYDLGNQALPQFIELDLGGASQRSLEDIWAFSAVEPQQLKKEQWEAFLNPDQLLKLQQIHERQSKNQFWVGIKGKFFTAYTESDRGTMSIYFFENRAAFEVWLLEDFKDYLVPKLRKTMVQSMSSSMWLVVGALCDLFLQDYPSPDVNWTAQNMLLFTPKNIKDSYAFSRKGAANQVWWAHWAALHRPKEIQPNEEELEAAILLLCDQGWLGSMGEIEGQDVYYVGQDLLWMIRSIAWWNGGWHLSNAKNIDYSLSFFQASAIWMLLEEKDSYHLLTTNPTNQQEVVAEFLDIALSSVKSTVVQKRFCTNCGAEAAIDANFCGACGHKL